MTDRMRKLSALIVNATFLSSCAITSGSENIARCPATEQTFRYETDDGGSLNINDGQSEISVSGLGIRTEHSHSWSLFINRESSGLLIRNYGAMNHRLVNGGSWDKDGLACQSTKLPNSIEVICKNSYGDLGGYRFQHGRGIDQLFIENGQYRQRARLVGDKGIFWNCRF